MGIADALKNWKLAPSAENDRDLVDAVNATELDTSLLSAKLRGYQLFGARYILKQKHVLLGDEMGLGKTIQAIAVIAHLSAKGAGRFLVVCPLSVMVNWAREIEKHSLLKAVAIHGNDRGEEYERWRTEGCVGVTSYETLERLPMKEIKALDLLVVDEAHNVKNSKARRTQNVLLLVQKAERVLYMTGTPLENRLEEMRYLIESIDHATGVKLKMLPSVMNKQFADMISHVYLRRNREDVLTELPELIETEEWIEMNETEKKAYKESLKSKNFMAVRRISWNAGEASGKLTRLKELCEEAKEDGRRVLVFSYFLDTLEICESALGADCVGRIDGGLSPLKRQELVDRFREASDGAVLLGQVTAAGVGLNIQAASVVIFCEPQLKPSMEEQAIARAYRMGQERGVTVYRLLIKDGIDERILEILREKQKLFESYADRSVVGDEDMKKNREAYIQEVMEDELKRLEGKDTEGVPVVEAHTAAEEAPAVEEHAAVKGMPAAEESPREEASNSETLPSEIEPAYSSTERKTDPGAIPHPDNNP
ncbi:MAG: DEAD/DEAH box helicase [Lachnospiraceae bacterium]|nr:DEAD/DEAH box helicase [Lachnospiraceae bacterium]